MKLIKALLKFFAIPLYMIAGLTIMYFISLYFTSRNEPSHGTPVPAQKEDKMSWYPLNLY